MLSNLTSFLAIIHTKLSEIKIKGGYNNSRALYIVLQRKAQGSYTFTYKRFAKSIFKN